MTNTRGDDKLDTTMMTHCIPADTYVRAWVASIPGVGPRRFSGLQARYPSLEPLLTLPRASLVASNIPEKLAQSIVKHRMLHTPESIKKYCEKHTIFILQPEDKAYPLLLKEISDPPVVLYVQGELVPPSSLHIAVVGTRRMTRYGEEVTRKFTRELVGEGCVIVSGFMYGVDACAHKTALECGGRTIGVLGFGFAYMYPEEHRELARRMLASGNCLLTEFAPWTSPVPGNFPSRNRIVSGMCKGVLVTEAASKSGSKITARCAVDQGREVFAVPGPIQSAFSEGTKELVNMGAKLVTNVGDIFDELGMAR